MDQLHQRATSTMPTIFGIARAFSRFGWRSESKCCYASALVLRRWRTSISYSLFAPLSGQCLRRAASAILEEQTSGHAQSSENTRRNNQRGHRDLVNPANLANWGILVSASAELELAFANLQGFDLVFKRRWWNSKLGRRP